MKRMQFGLLIVGLALAACGGRAIAEPGSDGSETGEPAPSSTANGSAGKRGQSDSLPSKPLGKCTPGFNRERNPTRACHWLSEDGTCFDDTEGACACICPTDRQSVCAHGFDDGPDSATFIYCD